MKNQTSWGTLLLVFLAVALLLVFCGSCNTAKQDYRNVNKAIIRHEAQTAQQAAARWPRITVSASHDSTSFKKSLDSARQLNDFYKTVLDNMEPIVQHDTIKPECEDYADNELKLLNIIFIKDNQIADLNSQIKNIRPVHDVDTVRDTREEAILTGRWQTSENNYQKMVQISQEQQGLLERKNKFIWWLLGLLSLSVILHFLRSKITKIPI